MGDGFRGRSLGVAAVIEDVVTDDDDNDNEGRRGRSRNTEKDDDIVGLYSIGWDWIRLLVVEAVFCVALSFCL